jgi:hypothetical protein
MALEDLCPLVRPVGVAGGVQGRLHGVSAGLLLGPGPRHGPGRGLVVTSVRGSVDPALHLDTSRRACSQWRRTSRQDVRARKGSLRLGFALVSVLQSILTRGRLRRLDLLWDLILAPPRDGASEALAFGRAPA